MQRPFTDQDAINRIYETYGKDFNQTQILAMIGMYQTYRGIGKDTLDAYSATIVDCHRIIKDIEFRRQLAARQMEA